MLKQLKSLCENCTMCPLGRSQHTANNKTFNPHVFSNMQESKYVVISQNPGFNECMQGTTFVGQSGKTFDEALKRHGLSRDMFYITNTVKCHTDKNRTPKNSEIKACTPILKMEMSYLQPNLVITLGRIAFNRFCPKEKYSDSLGQIRQSDFLKDIGGPKLNIYPMFHPSGMNLAIPERKQEFEEDIERLSKLIKHWEKHGFDASLC